MRTRKENTKQLIIASARSQFLARGYAATTVEMIARHAKLTKRTVYGYFPSKRVLLLEVVRASTGEPLPAHADFAEPKSYDDVRQTLLMIAMCLNDVTTRPDYIQLLRIAITEIPVQPDVGVLLEQGMASQSLQILGGFFEVAASKGLISIPNPMMAAQTFAGVFVLRMVLGGLLQPPSQSAIKKMSPAELTALVDSYMD